MRKHRQERVRSATRRMQRGRKTTGRIVVSTLAYSTDSSDPAKGESDRLGLPQAVQQFFREINDALAPDIVDPTAFAQAERVPALR